MSRGRPPLPMLPPGARGERKFIRSADAPLEPQQEAPQDADARPWELRAEGMVKFEVRFTRRHHALLQWLSEQSRRRSMHTILLDMLEPAIEEAVKAKREELGV